MNIEVVVGDILDDDGKNVASSLGPDAHFEHLDVRSEDDWNRTMAATASRFGPPTILVNNAAILRMGPLAQLDLATYREVVETNQIGPFLGMRAVIGPMTTAGGGSIINVSSVDGSQGTPGTFAYGTSTHWPSGLKHQ